MPTNMADVVKMAAAKAAVFSFSKVVYEDMVYVYLCVYINRYIYIHNHEIEDKYEDNIIHTHIYIYMNATVNIDIDINMNTTVNIDTNMNMNTIINVDFNIYKNEYA